VIAAIDPAARRAAKLAATKVFIEFPLLMMRIA
jgi:hypothetical protein